MGIQVDWDNADRTVILETFNDPWDWDDVATGLQQIHTLLESVEYKVHVICDLKRMPRIPGNFVTQASRLVVELPSNVDLIIFVTTNPLFKQLFYIFAASQGGLHFEYRFMTTMDEARGFLSNW